MGDVSGSAGAQGRSFGGLPEPLYAASPSRLLTWLDCPRRYRMTYLDRPRPVPRRQRAHTSLGLSVHNALRDWWDLPDGDRTPSAAAELLGTGWIDVGFRDADQSGSWRDRMRGAVTAYVQGLNPDAHPLGVERAVAMVTGQLRLHGRVDRLDDRAGELIVVDYKTGRRPPTEDDARFSLPLALYAAAVWKMFRRPCVRVELHHVPTGTVAAHTHTPQSLSNRVEEARSIAVDARGAERDYARAGTGSGRFPPRPSPLCTWCDLRAHCPEGQAVGPEQPDWAGLDPQDLPPDASGPGAASVT